MDQELIAYFDKRFRETSQQIADLRQDTTQQITSLRQDTTQQIASLREETIQRFEQVDRRLEGMEETNRHTLVLVEGLRHEVHIVAEAYLGLSYSVKRLRSEQEIFDQFKIWIEPYFGNLNRRVEALEGWVEDHHENVIDAVLRSLGKPPLQSPPASE